MYNKNVNSCEGIYNNSLDVRFGKACDNDCSFCIEKSGLDSLGSIKVDKMITSALLSDKEEILILGGEPFLDVTKLYIFIKAIRQQKRKIYITTSLPKTPKATLGESASFRRMIDTAINLRQCVVVYLSLRLQTAR